MIFFIPALRKYGCRLYKLVSKSIALFCARQLFNLNFVVYYSSLQVKIPVRLIAVLMHMSGFTCTKPCLSMQLLVWWSFVLDSKCKSCFGKQAAEIVWQDSGKFVATNSAVARTAILGVHQHDNLGQVIKNTLDICRVTHHDPRLVKHYKWLKHIHVYLKIVRQDFCPKLLSPPLFFSTEWAFVITLCLSSDHASVCQLL